MTVSNPLPHRLPGLRRSLVYSVAGNTVFAAGSWLTLAFLAKLTDPATVGQYVLALAVTAPLFLLFNLQLREVRATDHQERLPFATYLSSRLLTTSAALILALAFAACQDERTRLVIGLTAGAKALDAVIDIFYGHWLFQERQGTVAGSLALRGTTSILAMGAALVLTRSIVVASVASLIQSGLNLVHVWALYRREEGAANLSRLQRTDLLRLISLFPLGLAVAFDSLAINVPRYMIESHFGLAMVGVFGAIGAFMQVGGATVAVGLSQIGIPRLAKHYAAGNGAAYRSVLIKLLAVGVALGAGGLLASLLWGREILRAVLGAAYADHVSLLHLTMLNALVWYIGGILACGVTAMRNFKVQLPVFGLGMAAVTLTSLVIVPTFGMEGAALAILAGFLVRAIANGALVFRALRTL